MALESLGADIVSILHALKAYLAHRCVNLLNGGRQILTGCRDAQHPAAGGDQLMIFEDRACMKHLDAAHGFSQIVAGNRLTDYWFSGISLGSQNNADGWIRTPVCFVCPKSPLVSSGKQFHQVAP